MVGLKKKRNILESAEKLFSRYGFMNTSVGMIAQEAGISRGALYTYYGGKKEIFCELLGSFFSSVDRAIRKIDLKSNDSALYQIRRNMDDLVKVFYKRRYLTKLILNYAYGIDEEADEKISFFYKEAVVMIDKALRDGIELKLVRECNTYYVSLGLLGIIKELALHIIEENIVSAKEREDVINGFIDFALRGLWLEGERIIKEDNK